MTILASRIIDRVARQLVDVNNIVWQRSELLDWLNVGQRLIVMLQPNSTGKVAVLRNVVGTRQRIPSDGWILLDVVRNMGISGTVPGRAVKLVSRRLLDSFDPNWHASTPIGYTKSYVFDPQTQTDFMVHPASDGTEYLELTYSAIPDYITSESAALSLPDVYEDPLTHYVMFRAYSKNADFAANPQAETYLAMFNSALAAKVSVEQASNPNIAFTGSPVTVAGVS